MKTDAGRFRGGNPVETTIGVGIAVLVDEIAQRPADANNRGQIERPVGCRTQSQIVTERVKPDAPLPI